MVLLDLNGTTNMKKINFLKVSFMVLPILASCSVDFKKIEKKAALINRYEQVALMLEKENRELHAEVKRLEFDIEKLKQEKPFNKLSEHQAPHHKEIENNKVEVENPDHSRTIASVSPSTVLINNEKKDFVEFKTYKWHAEDLMKIADKEFKEKKYDKAAQFYTSLLNNYPSNKEISDEFYFKAGIASFESGIHNDWSLIHFEALMNKYPTSRYFRSAKLWVALTRMKMGDKKGFYATVEEFRKKYRNTNEWKILSAYYEKIEEKTNE